MQNLTVIHLVYRFSIGGLENVIVNMINSLPEQGFKHIIISLTDANQDFANKLQKNVEIYQLHKPEGNSLRIYRQLYALFRQLKPDILHTYNLATLEYQLAAAFAGVKYRIHAEHGRDIYDLDGSNKKYQLLRRLINPFIQQWVPVSQELASWLANTVKIPAHKICLIYNGIDIHKYQPRPATANAVFSIITVGRLAAVKDQLTLIKAVQILVNRQADNRHRLRLNIVGNGELKAQLSQYIIKNTLQDYVTLSGASHDVDKLLQQADLFVLPSLAEGIALTALEAMATGLPIIATDVGGNPELVETGINGQLLPPRDAEQIANSIEHYMHNRVLGISQGKAGRLKIETYFSLDIMTQKYLALYHKEPLNPI
jgi:sugar transferase (PEP-CTERM/EpsH1 system associated)